MLILLQKSRRSEFKNLVLNQKDNMESKYILFTMILNEKIGEMALCLKFRNPESLIETNLANNHWLSAMIVSDQVGERLKDNLIEIASNLNA